MPYKNVTTIYKDYRTAKSTYEHDLAIISADLSKDSWFRRRIASGGAYAWTPVDVLEEFEPWYEYKRCGPDLSNEVTTSEFLDFMNNEAQKVSEKNNLTFRSHAGQYQILYKKDVVWENGEFNNCDESVRNIILLIFLNFRASLTNKLHILRDKATKIENTNSTPEDTLPKEELSPTQRVLDSLINKASHFIENHETFGKTQVIEHFYNAIRDIQIAYHIENGSLDSAINALCLKTYDTSE